MKKMICALLLCASPLVAQAPYEEIEYLENFQVDIKAMKSLLHYIKNNPTSINDLIDSLERIDAKLEKDLEALRADQHFVR